MIIFHCILLSYNWEAFQNSFLFWSIFRVCARIYFSFATIFANQIFFVPFSWTLSQILAIFRPNRARFGGIFRKKCLLSLTPFILVGYCTHIDKITKEYSILYLKRLTVFKGPRTVSYSICPKFDCLWLDECIFDNFSFVLKSNPYISCTKQNINILKILHDYARTLGFWGWGYFLWPNFI